MIGFLFSRYGMMAIGLVALLIGHQAYKVHYRNQGKAIVIEQSNKEAEKLGDKAKTTRKRVDTLDDKHFNSVLKRYCADC